MDQDTLEKQKREHADGVNVDGAGMGRSKDDSQIFALKHRHLWVLFTTVGKAGAGVGSKKKKNGYCIK